MRAFIICAIVLLLLPAAFAADVVKEESSGAFRGSMRYIIDIGALEATGPTELEGLQAGDFISGKLPTGSSFPRYERTSIYLRRYDTSAETVIYDFGLDKQQVLATDEVVEIDFDLDGTADMNLMFEQFDNRDTVFTISIPGGAPPEEPDTPPAVEPETPPVVQPETPPEVPEPEEITPEPQTPPMPPVEVPEEYLPGGADEEPSSPVLAIIIILLLLIAMGALVYFLLWKK